MHHCYYGYTIKHKVLFTVGLVHCVGILDSDLHSLALAHARPSPYISCYSQISCEPAATWAKLQCVKESYSSRINRTKAQV